jgi:hypothetical protein
VVLDTLTVVKVLEQVVWVLFNPMVVGQVVVVALVLMYIQVEQL